MCCVCCGQCVAHGVLWAVRSVLCASVCVCMLLLDINTNVRLHLSFSPSLLHPLPFLRYDNDVSVFGKILRNEIDEDFRHVQVHFKWVILYMIMVNMTCYMVEFL